MSDRSVNNGAGQSNGQGPDATQRDWQQAMVKQAGETFWKYI